jgi:thiamine pyrophosphate-dependent acetolactate synthase large subunit-like protein
MILSRFKADDEMREAIRIALTGRQGPVHLSMPNCVIDRDEVPPLTPYLEGNKEFLRRMNML